MDLNGVVVKVLLEDVRHAPVVDLVLSIYKALDFESVGRGKQRELLRELKFVGRLLGYRIRCASLRQPLPDRVRSEDFRKSLGNLACVAACGSVLLVLAAASLIPCLSRVGLV